MDEDLFCRMRRHEYRNQYANSTTEKKMITEIDNIIAWFPGAFYSAG